VSELTALRSATEKAEQARGLLEKYGNTFRLESARKRWTFSLWLQRAMKRAEKVKPLLLTADPVWSNNDTFIIGGAISDRYHAKTVDMLLELASIPLGEVTWLQTFFPRFRLEWTCTELSRAAKSMGVTHNEQND
jgi:hypothetical protein